MRVRLREIIRQTCSEMGVRIEKGVLSNDPFICSCRSHRALSTVMQRMGRSSRKIQMEFPDLRKRYCDISEAM